jgi:hypothetical protein
MGVMTTLFCLPMEESSDLLGDNKLVPFKHELHFPMVDRRMFFISWRRLIAINCSSHHSSALAMAQAHQMHSSLQTQHDQARAVLVAVIIANAAKMILLLTMMNQCFVLV